MECLEEASCCPGVILRINAYTDGGTGVDLAEMQQALQGKQRAA